ncbi:hypothetical protein MPTK2_8g07480 [Marchantia polymorpha subsp. ruderalis]
MALRRQSTSSTVTSRSNPGMSQGDEDGGQKQNKPLQEWLEGISERMMKRIDTVGDEVQKIVDEMGAVELDLKNTFNSFRCLSSTQFVENRVYEEDETESVRAETPAKDSQHPFAPTESYEDEILPRYRDAVSTAWATFQEISHQHDQASRRLRSRNKVLRNLDYDGHLHLVPHIIGTDEFARDAQCGLADLRHKRPIVDGFEVDSDTEREGADLAAELVGAGSVSEGEWSDPESDLGDQGDGFEPAVSAALDFKAMLEAALRNPSLPYDGNTSTEDVDMYGQGIDNDYFLSNVTIDNYYGSPRTISRTVETGDHRASDDTTANKDTRDPGDWQLTASHVPANIAVQTTADSLDNITSQPLQPGRAEQPYRDTMEELLKKPFMLKTQNPMEEDKLNNSETNVPAEYNSLSNLPYIPGGLFDDDESDTVSIVGEFANVSDSNTEPTIPEGLFQRHPPPGAAEPSQEQARSSSTVDHSTSPLLVPPFTTGRQPSNVDITSLFKGQDNKGPTKLKIPDSSSSLGNTENISNRSNTSNGSRGQFTSQSIVRPQVRGGLFDDSDDDEEDTGNLFGVTDSGIDSQPGLRTWTSASSKGLFDDLENEDATDQNLFRQPSGSSHEGRNNDDVSSVLRKVMIPGPATGRLPQRQSSWSSNSDGSSDPLQKQISGSSPSPSASDRNLRQSLSSSPSGNTLQSKPKISSSSSLSESSPDPLQRQSLSSSPSGNTLQSKPKISSSSSLSESSPDPLQRQSLSSSPSRNAPESKPKISSSSSLSESSHDSLQRQSLSSSPSRNAPESKPKVSSSSSLPRSSPDPLQRQSPNSSPSRNTPTRDPKPSFSSSPSGSSPDPLQGQSPGYNLTASKQDRIHEQVFDPTLSESTIDRPKKPFSGTNLFGSFTSPTQTQPSRSSLVESVLDRTSIDSSPVKYEFKEDSGEDKPVEPHPSLESLLAAGIRPTVHSAVDSSDDSDAWSRSESGDEGDGDVDTSSRGKPDSPKSYKGFGATAESFASNYEEKSLSDSDGAKQPAAEPTVQHSRSSSVETASMVSVPEYTLKSPLFPLRSHDSSASSPSRPRRTFSDLQDLEMPEEQPLKPQSPIEEAIRPTYAFIDRRTNLGASSITDDDAGKLTHTTLSRPLGPAKRRAPSPIKPLKSTQSLPVQSPPRQIDTLPRNVSQNVFSGRDLTAPKIDIGRLTTGRAFTSLFDEDDGDDDLFGSELPPKQSNLQIGPKLQQTKSPLDLPVPQNMTRDEVKGPFPTVKSSRSPEDLFHTRERDEPAEVALKPKSPLDLFQTTRRDVSKEVAHPERSKMPLDRNVDLQTTTARDIEKEEDPSPARIRSPLPSRVPTASPAKISGLKAEDAKAPAGRPASRLSSLLFGDDDEDNEDALFGPLHEKSSRGSKDWLASSSSFNPARPTSSFNPARPTSSRRTSGSSLFDD